MLLPHKRPDDARGSFLCRLIIYTLIIDTLITCLLIIYMLIINMLTFNLLTILCRNSAPVKYLFQQTSEFLSNAPHPFYSMDFTMYSLVSHEIMRFFKLAL